MKVRNQKLNPKLYSRLIGMGLGAYPESRQERSSITNNGAQTMGEGVSEGRKTPKLFEILLIPCQKYVSPDTFTKNSRKSKILQPKNPRFARSMTLLPPPPPSDELIGGAE